MAAFWTDRGKKMLLEMLENSLTARAAAMYRPQYRRVMMVPASTAGADAWFEVVPGESIRAVPEIMVPEPCPEEAPAYTLNLHIDSEAHSEMAAELGRQIMAAYMDAVDAQLLASHDVASDRAVSEGQSVRLAGTDLYPTAPVTTLGRRLPLGTWGMEYYRGPGDPATAHEWYCALPRSARSGAVSWGVCHIHYFIAPDRTQLRVYIGVETRKEPGAPLEITKWVQHRMEASTVRIWRMIMDHGVRQSTVEHVTVDHESILDFFGHMAEELSLLYDEARYVRRGEVASMTLGMECDLVKWVMLPGELQPRTVLERLRAQGFAVELSHVEPWRMYEVVPRRIMNRRTQFLGAVAVCGCGEGAKIVQALEVMACPAILLSAGDPVPPLNLDTIAARQAAGLTYAEDDSPLSLVDV